MTYLLEKGSCITRILQVQHACCNSKKRQSVKLTEADTTRAWESLKAGARRSPRITHFPDATLLNEYRHQQERKADGIRAYSIPSANTNMCSFFLPYWIWCEGVGSGKRRISEDIILLRLFSWFVLAVHQAMTSYAQGSACSIRATLICCCWGHWAKVLGYLHRL